MSETSESDIFEEVKLHCPVCNSKNTKVTQKIVDIPYFPNLWLFTFICYDCHYKHNDFINLNIEDKPLRYIYHAENKEDYTTKIVRSANGTIRIPKIGAMIEPGPNADGFINNIEGVLREIEGKAKFLLNDAKTDEEKKKIEDYINNIEHIIEKNLPIDIVVEDPFGNSLIIPFDEKKLEKIDLSKEEAGKLKTSIIIFEKRKREE